MIQKGSWNRKLLGINLDYESPAKSAERVRTRTTSKQILEQKKGWFSFTVLILEPEESSASPGFWL